MEVSDYNGEGSWTRAEILARYARYAKEMGTVPRDLSPSEHSIPGRVWVYPVMFEVIDGILAGDAACIRLGVEFIEENAKFPFGKMLKSNTARALRRACLSEQQKQRIRRRVFGLLQAGHIPHEFRDYAKLVRSIGFSAEELPQVDTSNLYAARFDLYFKRVLRSEN